MLIDITNYLLNKVLVIKFLNEIKNFGEIITIDKLLINDELYNNFDIKIKNSIHKLNYHFDNVYCLTIMNDGRLASGGKDFSIIIYNKISYKPDL